MTSPSTAESPAASFAQLIYFRIYKISATEQQATLKIFGNKLQQCLVRVALIAADAQGNPVTLELEDIIPRLDLIQYVNGSELGEVTDGLLVLLVPGPYLWDESIISTAENYAKGYLPEAPEATATDATEEVALRAGAQITNFYISATPEAKPLQIAARFRLPNDVAFVTTNNSDVDDPDGQGDQGRFNSSVIIHPVKFPSLPDSSYGDTASDGTLMPHPVGSQAYFYSATEHYLHVNLNGQNLLLSAAWGPIFPDTFSIWKYGSSFDTVQWSVSYVGLWGNGDPYYFPKPPLRQIAADGAVYNPYEMFKTCVGSIVGTSDDRVVIGLLKGNIAATFRDEAGVEVPEETSTPLVIVDAYGNVHLLTLSFGSDASHIRITKR